jgi:muramoyltetrapeptide carboxypeptidase
MTAMPRVLPPRLRPGDVVGLVSPSAGTAALFPHRVERAVAQLERLGFRVRIGEHARNRAGYASDTPEHRVGDLHAFFADPTVRAIVTMIGGDHANELLPLLDYALIRANPTILMGYSDITVLQLALWARCGLVTFYGPHAMTELAEFPEMPEYSREAMLRVLKHAEPAGVLAASPWWTDERLSWEQREDLTRARERRPTPGWTWLADGEGVAEGPLIGGNLETLQRLRSTTYWPALDGAVLFLETSEERPSPQTVDALLMDFENMGMLSRIAALLYGRPQDYAPDERVEVREVLQRRTARYNIPVVADMDFGHTSPMLTLPIGVRARVDGASRRISIIEAAVE